MATEDDEIFAGDVLELAAMGVGEQEANSTMAMSGPMPRMVAVIDWLVIASSGAAMARLAERPSTPATFAHELAELRSPVGNSSDV